jgi:hypothetical protein
MSTEQGGSTESSGTLMILMAVAAVAGWGSAIPHYLDGRQAEDALVQAKQALVQAEGEQTQAASQLQEQVQGLRVAIASVADTIEIEDLNPRGLFITVSLHERWLEVYDNDALIWNAPVAIGRGFRDQEDQVFFSTPRGRRQIESKVKNPVWIPPDWHYREVSGWSGAQTVSLSRGGSVGLSDGSKIVVRNNSVGRVSKTGGFKPYSAGRDVVVDGKVIIPPFGTKQRRKAFVMGSRKLGIGGAFAIHGTNKPVSIGRAASHGCLRMLNKDIQELYPLVEVGTPVFIY